MTCEVCHFEHCGVALFARPEIGSSMACKRCRMILTEALDQCQQSPMEIRIERAINEQWEMISTPLAAFENLRRMTRQEFRELLRLRLQVFGDKCMAEWEKVAHPRAE